MSFVITSSTIKYHASKRVRNFVMLTGSEGYYTPVVWGCTVCIFVVSFGWIFEAPDINFVGSLFYELLWLLLRTFVACVVRFCSQIHMTFCGYFYELLWSSNLWILWFKKFVGSKMTAQNLWVFVVLVTNFRDVVYEFLGVLVWEFLLSSK